jgi:hypothetical protein
MIRNDAEQLRALDAMQSLCDPASPLLVAFTEAAGAASHAAAIRLKEHPTPPSKEETAAAVAAMIAGRPQPSTDSALLRAADRRALHSFVHFLETPAATLPELAFKALAYVCTFPGGIPPQLIEDATRIAGGTHG